MRLQTIIPLRFETSKGIIELKPGDTFKPKNEDTIKGLLAEGKVRPLRDVLAEKYNELANWLHRFDLGGDELKETLPGLYDAIQKAINDMDSAFYAEDLSAFQDALDKVRMLYTEALLRCGRKVAYKVYSEVLGSHLWIVETDQDMHFLRSQGVSEAIYTHDEIKKLKKLSKEALREIHKVKEVFEHSKVEEIKRRNDLNDKDTL